MNANLQNARNHWAWISWILEQERAEPRIFGTLYKSVVRATVLFGAEAWVMLPRIGNTLGGFHHRVAHRLEGMRPRQDMMGRWVYPPLDAEMSDLVLEEVDT